MLLDKGCPVDIRNAQKETALTLAVMYNRAETVKVPPTPCVSFFTCHVRFKLTPQHDTTRPTTRLTTRTSCSTCWRREPTREFRTGWAGRCATRQSNRSPPTRRPSRSCWMPCRPRKVTSRRHRPDTPPTHSRNTHTTHDTHLRRCLMLHRNGSGEDRIVPGVRGSLLAAVRQVQSRLLLLTRVSAQVSRRLRAHRAWHIITVNAAPRMVTGTGPATKSPASHEQRKTKRDERRAHETNTGKQEHAPVVVC
jgi:hypothetical protein